MKDRTESDNNIIRAISRSLSKTIVEPSQTFLSPFSSPSHDNKSEQYSSDTELLPSYQPLKHIVYGRNFCHNAKTKLFTIKKDPGNDFFRVNQSFTINSIHYKFNDYLNEVAARLEFIAEGYLQTLDQLAPPKSDADVIFKLDLSIVELAGLSFDPTDYSHIVANYILNKINNEPIASIKTSISHSKIINDWLNNLQQQIPHQFQSIVTTLIPYMHTNYGLIDQCMNFSSIMMEQHGEKIMPGNRESVIKLRRAIHDCNYQLIPEDNSIQIKETKEFYTVNFQLPTTTETLDEELTGPELNGLPSVTITSHTRYLTNYSAKLYHYDLRRRLCSAVLGVNNIEDQDYISAESIANAFIKTVTSTTNNNINTITSLTNFDVSLFEQASNLSEFLYNDDGFILETNNSLLVPGSASDHQHKFIIEAMEIELAPQYSQHAYKTQAEILASIFIERAILHFILGNLTHTVEETEQGFPLFLNDENKYGCCICLLNYLNHPLPYSTTAFLINKIAYSNQLRNLINNIDRFTIELNETILLLTEITQVLSENFAQHDLRVKTHYAQLYRCSPEMVWENEKICLRKLYLPELLFNIAEQTTNQPLNQFASQLIIALSPGYDQSLTRFQQLIDQTQTINNITPLITHIFELLSKLVQACAKPYRSDFTTTPGQSHYFGKLPDNITVIENIPNFSYFSYSEPHLFYQYRITNIVPILARIEDTVNQLSKLIVVENLLTGCQTLIHRERKIELILKQTINQFSRILQFTHLAMLKDSSLISDDYLRKYPYRLSIVKQHETITIYWCLKNNKPEYQSKNITAIEQLVTQLPEPGQIIELTPELLYQVTSTFNCNIGKLINNKYYALIDQLLTSNYVIEDLQQLAILLDNNLQRAYLPILEELFITLCKKIVENECPTTSLDYIDHVFYFAQKFDRCFYIYNQFIELKLTEISLNNHNSINSDEYITALCIRHFYFIFFADYLWHTQQKYVTKDNSELSLSKQSGLYRNDLQHCLYPGFFDDSQQGWVTKFDAISSATDIAIIISKLYSINSSVSQSLSSDTSSLEYYNIIAQKLQQLSHTALSSKAQDIFMLCTWLTVLVQRHHGLPLACIYQQITAVLARLDLPIINTLWEQYITLETLGAKTEKCCNDRFGCANLSPNHELDTNISTYQSNIVLDCQLPRTKSIDNSLNNPVEQFLIEGDSLIDHPEQHTLLAKTLWRHIAKRIVYFVSKNLLNKHTKKNTFWKVMPKAISDKLLQITPANLNQATSIKQNLLKIYINLLYLYLNKQSLPQVFYIYLIDVFFHDITERRRQELLNTLSVKLNYWRNQAEKNYQYIVRAIFFTHYQHQLFASNNYFLTINQLLEDSFNTEGNIVNQLMNAISPLDNSNNHLDILIFLDKLSITLNFTYEQLMKFYYYDQFFYFITLPLLESFYLIHKHIYGLAKQKKSVLSRIKTHWRSCLTIIDQMAQIPSIAEFKYCLYDFIMTWQEIINSLIIIPSNQLGKAIELVDLANKPIDTIAMYYLASNLRLPNATTYANELWHTTFAEYDLSPHNSKLLNFLFKSSHVYGLKPLSQLQVTYRNIAKKQQELIKFFTTNNNQTPGPVKAIICLANIFCIHIDSNYPHHASRHWFSNSLLRMAHHIFRIYQMRLQLYHQVVNLLHKPGVQLDDNERKILQHTILDSPIDFPLIFVYLHGHNYYCLEIYQTNYTEISQQAIHPILAKHSLLLKQAACALPDILSAGEVVPSPNTVLKQIIHQETESVRTSILQQTNFSINFSINLSMDILCIIYDVLLDSMSVIYRSALSDKTPISYCLFQTESIHIAPEELIKLNQFTLIGLVTLGMIYRILSTLEYQQATLVHNWLQQLSIFFNDSTQLESLGHHGIINSKIIECVNPSSDDPVIQQLHELNTVLSTKSNLTEYCLFYKELKMVWTTSDKQKPASKLKQY